jgi:predicted phage terminase large subunit-like protein
VTFIYATLYDNKILMEKDPGYLANLKAQSKVDRERLLEGNWKIEPSAGNIFNKAWFGSIPAAPSGGEIVLFWDFASTEKALNKPDPDFTAATAMQKKDGRFAVLDCVDFQSGPAETEKKFVNVSRQWAAKAKQLGATFKVRWEQEPGSASKRDAARLSSLLAGLDAHAVGTGGKDKITRAKALSAQAEAGNVDVVEADWNERYLNHMHNQPEADHDDIMDSSSGAFNALTDDGNALVEMYRKQLEDMKMKKSEVRMQNVE